METKKLLMSLGTAIAASKVAKTVSNIEIEDVLGTLGLSRRRSHFLENLGLVAAGALVGAGAAILFAPSSGSETRRRLGSEASKLGSAAKEALREQKDEALRSLSHVANGAVTSTSARE
ncbi:MAG TPA: YtxH domain-containing protein [Polyangiaceae bacterium]|nr:YtxH domain-containing protein [Polyangiaceae bacterium]